MTVKCSYIYVECFDTKIFSHFYGDANNTPALIAIAMGLLCADDVSLLIGSIR